MAKARQAKAKKPAAKPKVKAGSKVKAMAKADKPSIEKMSDQQRWELTFRHKNKLKPLLEAERQAKAAVNHAYELAKKDGVPKAEIKLAILFETEEGEEKQRVEYERTKRVARWAGATLELQLDMFPKATRDQQVYEAGQRAAFDDEPRKPPSHYAQADAQQWMKGWDEGRTLQNVERATTGFRSVGEVAKGVAVVNSLVEDTEPDPSTLPLPEPAQTSDAVAH